MNPRVRLHFSHQHSQFWPIPARFMGYCSSFWLPERFPLLTNTRVRLRVGHQHSPFWPILTRIMDYYSAFWCLKAIFMADEPQGALTCRSSTLAVLADSDPFHGLLLIFSAPGAISTIDEHWGAFTCRSSTLAVLADSGQYHGLLLSVLVSQSDFHGC